MAALVDDALVDTHNLTSEAATDLGRIRDFSIDDIDLGGWSGEWKGTFFADMWELREDLEQTGFKLDRNLAIIKRVSELESWHDEGYDAGRTTCDMWEWEDLRVSRNFAIQMLDRTRGSYVEAVQATAAHARRITGFATVFVPASLCAAVLAIPSFAGASDTQKFWIFWVVSVPLGIIAWIWFVPQGIYGDADCCGESDQRLGPGRYRVPEQRLLPGAQEDTLGVKAIGLGRLPVTSADEDIRSLRDANGDTAEALARSAGC
ncbi:uncharacterized protein DNG_07456 [Cephalotrichum gorgonifer]|uniref:Uncharacterized protein n=1 Tax=Cephalotrichum gorgonifer TaxID=2041049 RepID=A0AAE8SXF3_9PEZI|nr:uncharacterized protein DNG_07456 [Cephalotrichum gorgonifer]